jgi:hypothetical protein
LLIKRFFSGKYGIDFLTETSIKMGLSDEIIAEIRKNSSSGIRASNYTRIRFAKDLLRRRPVNL